jgi:hypothetical protein
MLPARLRRAMESLFDADFADVRLIEGSEPLSFGAVAFACGPRIYFAPGAFDPVSAAGRSLLAHELTHVLQHRAGLARPATAHRVLRDPVLEAEADRMAMRAAQLRPLSREELLAVPAAPPPADAPLLPQVIWVPKKSAEYGFVAEVDQREVDETADTIVGRGHGPKVSLLDTFQLDMGTSKTIYIVGHSMGRAVSGYNGQQMIDALTPKTFKPNMRFKIMACNVGMINGFVVDFNRLIPDKTIEAKGVDRIVYYTAENKFLYTEFPIDTTQYDQDTLRKNADDALVNGTWAKVKAAMKANPELIKKFSGFYGQLNVKAPAVNSVVAKHQQAKPDATKVLDDLLAIMELQVNNTAGPKLAYQLRDHAGKTPELTTLKGEIDLVFQVFQSSVATAWVQKKDFLRKHHHLDVEAMTGPGRLKHIHDKGNPLRPLRPYVV